MLINRWSTAIFLAGVILLSGCGSSNGTRSMRMSTAENSSSYLGTFDKLWAERTVLLTSERPGGGMPFLPGAGSSGRGEGSPFPISVRATLMDSALISAGIEEFSNLASMKPEEADQFRNLYEKTFTATDSIFVWVEMQTTSTEEFLQLDRWTMFLENEEGRQVEPGRIVEHPVHRQRTSSMPVTDGGMEEPEDGSRVWEPVTKDVELYFPALPDANQKRIPLQTRNLKIVLLDPRNPAIRAEGEWRHSSSHESGKER